MSTVGLLILFIIRLDFLSISTIYMNKWARIMGYVRHAHFTLLNAFKSMIKFLLFCGSFDLEISSSNES